MEHFTPSEAPIHETARLPVKPPARMIGREPELGQTFAQARAGAAVVVHGPSGVGKSALAATIAAAFTALPGGVLWWPAKHDNLEQLIARLGRAYGDHAISDSPTPLEHMDAARRLLERDNKPLIVLDDIADLEAARDFVRKVAPGIPTILTSEYAPPGPWMPIQVSFLAGQDAIDLFMQASGLEQVSSVVRTDIQGICQALRGSALAITLAARWVRATGQQPGEFLGTLTTPGHSGPLLGLYSVIQSLPEALQGMLLSMGATFAGQASAALLEFLTTSPPETVDYVMDMLAARGLVHALPGQGILTSYRLHEMVHNFMQSWLHGIDRLETTTAHTCEAVVTYVEQHGTDTREARDHLIVEMPNILGAARYAVYRGDGATVHRLLATLSEAFGSVGGYGYEIQLLQSMATHLGPAATQMALPSMEESRTPAAGEDVPVVSPEAPPLQETVPEGVTFDTTPLKPISRPAPAPATAVTEAEPETPPEAPPEAPPGAPELERAVPFEAEETLPDEPVPEPPPAALADAAALNAQGQALLENGQRDAALATFTEALTLAEASDDVPEMLTALEALAGIGLEDGDLDDAVVYASRARNLVTQLNDPAREGHALALLGDVRLELGELDNAIATYVSAIETLQATGDTLSLGIVEAKLGSAHLNQGNFTQAIAMLSTANAIFRDAERPDYQLSVLENLGAAYSQLSQQDEAEQYHQEALALAEMLEDIEAQERQLAALADIAQARGDRPALTAYYRQALNLAYQADVVRWQIRYLDALGRLLMDDVTQVGIAVALLEEVEAIAPDEGRARLLNRARTRLERAEASGMTQAPMPANIADWAEAGASEVDTEA